MIQFENPVAFILLFLIPLLYIFRFLGIFSRISFPLTFSDWGGSSFTFKNPSQSLASFLSHFFFIAGFVFFTVAFSNPVIRHQEKVYDSRGADVLFVLDTSPSMEARDISLVTGEVTRMEAAKLGIKTLVSANNGASYALVAMGSEAACIVPPTAETDLFLKRLFSLSAGEFGEGSAIGTGLCTAVYHLAKSAAPQKCIVLITDGENNAGEIHPETAANLAKENGIALYCFGIGTKGSVPIEYADKKTGKVRKGYYESDFDSAPLEKLASIADGEFFGIESLDSLSDALGKISSSQIESVPQNFHYRTFDTDCYGNFLLLSLIFFAAAFFIKRILLSEIL